MSLTTVLTIDLAAIVANWRALDSRSPPGVTTAAVVKADAYGCGAKAVGPALAKAGVGTFFVAQPREGVALRQAIGPEPAVYILGGYPASKSSNDERALYTQNDLRPCLNSATQAQAWFRDQPSAPAAIQLDTGMNRLGMEAAEFSSLGPLPNSVSLIMSHMGCADQPKSPVSPAQLAEFRRLTNGLDIPRSLSATAGMLLGPDYHFDLTRMGIGLYGGWPFVEARPVVRIDAPVIQVRDVAANETVGYGAAWTSQRPSRIATISVGYADGLIRALSNGCTGFIGGQPVPFAGRVSMDLITVDVTDCPCTHGDFVEILGPNQSIDTLAAAAGTIGHEVLTSLGGRYQRSYLNE